MKQALDDEQRDINMTHDRRITQNEMGLQMQSRKRIKLSIFSDKKERKKTPLCCLSFSWTTRLRETGLDLSNTDVIVSKSLKWAINFRQNRFIRHSSGKGKGIITRIIIREKRNVTTVVSRLQPCLLLMPFWTENIRKELPF